MNNDNIKEVLLDILCTGLLRIRAFGNSGDADACSLEADHLHNLPELLRSFRWELLHFYFTVERLGFLSREPRGAEQFAPLWDRLAKLIESSERGTRSEKGSEKGTS